MKYLILLFVMFMTCCSPKAPVTVGPQYTHHAPAGGHMLEVPVWISSDLGAKLSMDASDALNQWNIALNGHLHFYEAGAPSLENLMYLAHGGLGLMFVGASQDDAPSLGVLGWVDEIGEPIIHIVTDNLNVPDMTVVMMHEMGHSMGLEHTPIPGALMNPYWTNQPDCIDIATASALAYQHGWPVMSMNWCVQ